MKLNPHEAGSPLWQRIEAELNQELATFRARAEHPLLPADERQGLLWRIYQIKEFLAWAKQPEPKGDGRRP